MNQTLLSARRLLARIATPTRRPGASLLLATVLAACSGGGSDNPIGTAVPDGSPPNAGVPGGTAPGASGSQPVVTPTGKAAWVRNVLKVFVGEPVELDLAPSTPDFARLDRNSWQWTIQLAPTTLGLAVQGSLLGGAPTQAGSTLATVTGTDATGRTTKQEVTIAAMHRKTTGEPNLGSFDYVGTTLPRWYTDPAYPVPAGTASLAAADTIRGAGTPTNASIALGRALFFDTRLSVNDTVSCATCHVPALGFSDPTPLSTGALGLVGPRNSPGLTNVRYFPGGQMFWDQHARSLEHQASFPIESGTEMGSSLSAVVAKVSAMSFYPPLFEAAFGPPAAGTTSPVNATRLGEALAQFQRTLVSTQSKYDKALAGDGSPNAVPDFLNTFTQQEMRGRALFEPVDAAELARAGLPPITSMGCSTCHTTPGQISGLGLQDVGLPGANGVGTSGAFKAPSLRNVELTGPYMHDGRIEKLEDVIRFFATGVVDAPTTSRYLREGNQAGGAIRRHAVTDEDVAALVAFLKTLTDRSLLGDPKVQSPFGG